MDTFIEFLPDESFLDNYWMLRKWIEKFNKKNQRKVIFSHGMTRHVLISADYVIKWDCPESDGWLRRVGGCEKEHQHYLEAVKEGYAYLLAQTTPCTIKGRKFYIMPRISCSSYDTKGNRSDMYSMLTDKEAEWIDDHFSDLHGNNWGIKNNKPVLFDYACR